KPFYHYKPGTQVLSVGTPGCNFSCLNCQNHDLSQAKNQISNTSSNYLEPEKIAALADEHNVDGIAYTYSEPTIFFEYVNDIIEACRRNPNLERLPQMLVSNGYFSKELFDYIEKHKLIDAINIDLKFMNESKYKRICGAKLQPVLDNIERIYNSKNGIHLEIINLVIPGENDSDHDFQAVADYIKSISPDIPLHFSRFHPTYKMADKPATDIQRLLKAKEIAQKAGINYVYIGNTGLSEVSDTRCPHCGELLIARDRYSEIKSHLGNKGISKCPQCEKDINIILCKEYSSCKFIIFLYFQNEH
ncbi:MAG: AmmeMemoRadiSam system radical SAM enzyme, partial [Candidatus Kapabacteria bacterium]|nr:AmmeMemoRadiSam system radical SAM enzyme [Candidatus Kapabacteria bacterium]